MLSARAVNGRPPMVGVGRLWSGVRIAAGCAAGAVISAMTAFQGSVSDIASSSS